MLHSKRASEAPSWDCLTLYKDQSNKFRHIQPICCTLLEQHALLTHALANCASLGQSSPPLSSHACQVYALCTSKSAPVNYCAPAEHESARVLTETLLPAGQLVGDVGPLDASTRPKTIKASIGMFVGAPAGDWRWHC